ncbi:hypothetical protein Cgig2_026437 [Carnegiea gigantea]|uniref:Ty3 transposon capsid-like protein domain-containing protein n=1 Tax=Carnegiea gigantea TaxID=171969 RepID=A0A9Q1QM73_9CARY|nr:hypothetical protein Cgig2_026437 [Carnegiea gigantea]
MEVISFSSIQRWSFPCFDGQDPKGWIKKCTRYFSLCRIQDEQKVDLAALHLRGSAEMWFGSYIMGRRGLTWDEFIVDICARFKDNLGSKVIEDFNKLCQVGTIDEYLAKFEELRALMLVRTPTMPEAYFLESFIGGLKPAVKPLVRAFNPQTLPSAIEHARYQEEHLLALKLHPEKPYKPSFSNANNSQRGLLPTPNITPLAPQKAFPSLPKTPNTYSNQRNFISNLQRPTRFVPAAERAEKIAKGLCFLCHQPFERGHKCGYKEKQLFLVEVLGEEEEAQENIGVKEAEDEEEDLIPRTNLCRNWFARNWVLIHQNPASLVSEHRINWVSKPLKLASTRTQAAMEEAMGALLAEQRQWMQDQIADQNRRIVTQQQQFMEQQQKMREQ